MASPEKTIKIDPDIARAVVTQLIAAADGLDPAFAKLDEIRTAFRRETAQYTKDGKPGNYYSALDTSLDTGLRKISEAIAQQKRNLLNDAAAISSLTDGLEESANAAATRIAAIATT